MNELISFGPELSGAFSLQKGTTTLLTSPWHSTISTFLAQIAGHLVMSGRGVLVIHHNVGDTGYFHDCLLTSGSHLVSGNRVRWNHVQQYNWDVLSVSPRYRTIIGEVSKKAGKRMANTTWIRGANCPNWQANFDTILARANRHMQAFNNTSIDVVIIENIMDAVSQFSAEEIPNYKNDIPWMLGTLRKSNVAIVAGCLSLDSAEYKQYTPAFSFLHNQLPGHVDHLYRLSGIVDLDPDALEAQDKYQYISHFDVKWGTIHTFALTYNHIRRQYKICRNQS